MGTEPQNGHCCEYVNRFTHEYLVRPFLTITRSILRVRLSFATGRMPYSGHTFLNGHGAATRARGLV
jgi:hypothetical protein